MVLFRYIPKNISRMGKPDEKRWSHRERQLRNTYKVWCNTAVIRIFQVTKKSHTSFDNF